MHEFDEHGIGEGGKVQPVPKEVWQLQGLPEAHQDLPAGKGQEV